MPGADGYPEGTQSLNTDSEQRSLVKIVSLLAGGGGGGGGQNQTPWLSPIDGGGFSLTNVNDIQTASINANAGTFTTIAADSGIPTTFNGAFLDPNSNVTGNEQDFYKSLVSGGGDGSLWTKAVGSGNGNNTGWLS